MIRKFVQGNVTTDSELFSSIGKWAVSEDIHKALGMPVTSREEDIWFILSDKIGLAGFCQVRVQKNATAHLRYLYYNKLPDGKKLLTAALAEFSGTGTKIVFTNDRKIATIWTLFGFKEQVSKCKGSFVQWRKELL